MNELFLDTETTGLSPNDGHKIVEIACIETSDLISTKSIFQFPSSPSLIGEFPLHVISQLSTYYYAQLFQFISSFI